MFLNHIILRNFRNYEYKEFEFIPNVNIILGQNAMGKTNLLESVHMLTGAGSFRTVKKSDLIRWGCEEAGIEATVHSCERDFSLKLHLPSAKAPTAYINGVKRPVAKGLSGVLKCVVFSPEDLFIVSSSPSQRRSFIDRALCQLRPNYSLLLSKYNKLLEGKNKILKNWDVKPEFHGILPDYTEKMAALSAQIISYRHRFLQAIAPLAADVQREISGGTESLSLQYRTVSSITDTGASLQELYEQVLSHSQNHGAAEIASRVCLSGIHKDDFDLAINEKSAKSFASQGQTRTAALALKLAEHHLFFRDLGEHPLLLLDDVFSELDATRRRYIMEKIGGGQVLISSCYDEGDNFSENANIIRVSS